MTNQEAIFNISTTDDFNNLALKVFRYQFENIPVYRSYCDLLYKHPSDILHVEEIPFLPIQFFKSHRVVSTNKPIEKIFSSSGTTGSLVSKHYITDLNIYESSFTKGFEHFYGAIDDYVILALLPSYLERDGSSLVYMANDLIKKSNRPESNFYLHNIETLIATIKSLEERKQKTLLLGVSFALLDLIELHQFKLKHTIIMETGGMKGRRKELIRHELHQRLKIGFGVPFIHSEYGMTELLGQAYSKGNGVFETPPWMKVLVRSTDDPLNLVESFKTGGLNIIDLSNLNSCAFIATQDLGKTISDNQFEIIGRFDHSDIRGCNLMAL